MNIALSAFSQRIFVALSASLLIHSALMWLPPIELPVAEPDLPPLVAKLIPLPVAAPQSRKPPASPVRSDRRSDLPAASNTLTASAVTSASSVPATPEDKQIAAASTVKATNTSVVSSVAAATGPLLAPPGFPASAVAAAEPAPPPRPLLPRRAQLKFQVRIGKDGMAVGEARHVLEINDGRYELTATTRTIGLARLVKAYTLVQLSNGETDGINLRPAVYSEEKNDDGQKNGNTVTLDYARKKMLFSSGRRLPLKTPTQDMLSILYQFPPLPEAGDVLPVSITNGRDWEQYRFEVTTGEILITPLGKLHTVHFRKLHAPGKEGLEIWFAQEYRLLPVKLRHLDRDGSVAGEAVITDIRISEN